ncbi:aspartate dehydrogenase domain-containing protein [Halobaculum marinum]|uniref:Aspartate dehydrogenase domain-containing protein n=1 Tax=Halobaculum marinum TaxID=3031996 RepID=A0ABD5WUR9_9EURY|nr:aspartate dehydrogenase domain-containing protein [Halobaculum sp. DT55]
MSDTPRLAVVGSGRIGADLIERAQAAEDVDLVGVLVRTEKGFLDPDLQVTTPADLVARHPDLIVEAATPGVLVDYAEELLAAADLMALSGSAFADPDDEAHLRAASDEAGNAIYLPHAALFGIDGLADARSELDSVHIEARKDPAHLDFEYAEEAPEFEAGAGETVLYEGPTRGLCRRFPRNFNSHASAALAGLGLDDTTSTLIADPDAETAYHEITATGEGFELVAVRDSAIEGVTGDFTLVSTWGSVRRVLATGGGLRFV